MRGTLDEYRGTFFPLTVQRLTAGILGSYADVAVAHMGESIEKVAKDAEEKLKVVQSELKEFQKMQNHLTELESAISKADGEIDELTDRYGQTNPDDLIQPFKAEASAEAETPAAADDSTDEVSLETADETENV